MKKLILLLLASIAFHYSFAQDASALVKKLKAKLDKVNDYIAEGKMKTDVAFIKAPAGKVKLFYKKPDKFKVKRNGGISILPKGGVSVNMSSLLASDQYVAIASGNANINGTNVKVVKLLPTNESSNVVLTTLYIDEASLLVKKASSTTRENGTYDMEMNYGKYASYGLPDKVVFSFNTKDYKMPKGVTLEFETGTPDKSKLSNRKGRVELTYNTYSINQGLADSEFK